MSIDPAAAAAPAPKRARTPYRPPLLSLWARNDLADNIVACLPPSNLSRLPVIAKAMRSAHPLVLFTAARRLGVIAQATDNFVSSLRSVVPERHCFREDWTKGLTRWVNGSGMAGHEWAVVDSPPRTHLRLTRDTNDDPALSPYGGPSHHGGLGGHPGGMFHRFCQTHWELAVRRFRVSLCFPNGIGRSALGYAWLRDNSGLRTIGGVYASPMSVPSLKWQAAMWVDEGDVVAVRNCYIDLCPVTPGVWYDVEATFSEADDDGYVTTTIVVSFNGDFRRKTMRSLALPLHLVKIYNLRDGQVLVGGLELEYDEVPQVRAVGDGPECRCGAAAARNVVLGGEENERRAFYHCGSCGFFEWDDGDDESEDA